MEPGQTTPQSGAGNESSVGLRLMAVHAHPDDESSNGAAVSAQYSAQGAEILVVTCTGGELGEIINSQLQGDDDLLARLPEVRREEMAKAAEILGVQHHWLGYPDSGFPEGLWEGKTGAAVPDGSFASFDPEVPARDVAALIRSFRPHVVTTYNEIGGYPHPDHIQAHKVASVAFTMAGDAAAEVAGNPWQPAKLYYFGGFSDRRINALHQGLLDAGMESPYEGFGDRIRMLRSRAPKPHIARLRCVDYFGHRDAALRAHATQVDPGGHFFATPFDVESKVWPYDEYELAASTVPVSLPETDLFAGIRDTDVIHTGGDPATLHTW